MFTKCIRRKKVPIAISILLLGNILYADISGIVYTDFNLNGVKDTNDVILKGVTVNAICEDENTYTSATNDNGEYTLSGLPSGKYCRVEADPSSYGLNSSSNSAGSEPLVDRVLDGTTDHDISVASAGTYCQDNPEVLAVAVPAIKDDGTTSYSPGSNSPTLLRTTQPSEGNYNDQTTIDDNRETLATYHATGSTWGLAYKRDTHDTFMAASLKPYANLGTDGIGAIYKVAPDNTITTFTTIPNASSSDLNTYLTDRDVEFDDDDVYPFIAREGLGDIEISEDYQTLYVLNMFEKTILEVNATSGDILKTTHISNPYDGVCPDSDVRPWALAVKGNDVYIGSVCESKISPDDGGLGASIQKYSVGGMIQEIARTNTLDYLKPYYKNPTQEASGKFNYKSWQENKTSPILTDIEFSNNNDLILGYTNRLSFMRHGNNKLAILGGDIRKMCYNADGSYTDESTAAAPTTCNSHTTRYGTDETYYEFYVGDFFGDNYGENGHPETMAGALVQEAGKAYITTSMIDGTAFEGPGSITQLSHVSGEKVGVQALIKSLDNDEEEAEVYGRKAGGLGDIELICDPAPIEIGNYVWVDLNEDGIQDPNETPLDNITVTLWDGDTKIGETTTDSTGHYYFGGLTNAAMFYGKSITSHHSYSVKIATSQDDITTATTANPNDPEDDIRDNDAQDNGTDLVIDFQTKANNDHSLDFGIKPVKIGDKVWIEDDNDGNATTGTITLVDGSIVTATCDGKTYTDITNSSGLYEIKVPANVNCTVTLDKPVGTIPTLHSDDNSVDDTSSENDKTHDATGTTVHVGKVDNMTLDFGFIVVDTKIDIEKATNGKDADTAADAKVLHYDDNVTWSYVITNTGNEPLENIAASDDKEGSLDCPKNTLDLGESMTCTAKTGTADEATYENKATVTAKGATSGNDTEDEDLSHYKIDATPVIDIEKATNGIDADAPSDAVVLHYGDAVTWSYVITNRGDEPLENIAASDDKLGGIVCPKTTLDINESMTCTSKTGTADVATYENKASVTGEGLISNKPTSDEDLSHYKIDATPVIDIEKATNGKDADTVADAKILNGGDTVTWSYVVTNIGDEPLQNIVASDDLEGTITCPYSTLDVGKSMTCTSKTGTANVATYENKASVTAKGTISTNDTSDEDLSHYKSYVKIGNRVWIEADNDGDATTGQIVPVKGTTVHAQCNGVDYSATTDSNGLYMITVPTNIGECTVTVATPSGSTPTNGSDDNQVDNTVSEENKTHDGSGTTVTVGTVDNMTLDFGFFVPKPEITIEKTTNTVDADSPAEAVELTYGDAVVWSYIVSNTGSEDLKNIIAVDNKEGTITCPHTTLAVGEDMVCTTKTSTADKLIYENKASVGATAVTTGESVNDDDLSHYKLKTVKIGNRVWIESDNDGDATTGSVTPVSGATVRAVCDGHTYTSTTDSHGLYQITVPAEIGECTLTVSTPNGTLASAGSDDNSVDDTTSEEDKTHNGSGTKITVGTIDNMTLDFGFYKKPKYFDLALTKKLTKSGTYTQGDTVKFAITVINQGNINATNIYVNDYIPTGLSLNDSKWKVSGNKATLKTPISSLAAGSRKTVYISFTVNDNFYGTEIINNAEIRSASGGTDVDSTPNSENGSVPDCNNHITSETNGKDDYDCAKITLIPSDIQPTPTPTPTPNPHAKPGRPLSVKTTQVENGIKLSWADNSTNETGFKIYQDNKLIAIVPADTTEYTLENLDSNTMYTIKIVAFNSSSTSSASIITFTTKDDYGWMIPAIYYMQLQ